MNNLLQQKILDFIRDNGYTKHSFAKLIGSTKGDIDKLIKGTLKQEKTKEIMRNIEQKLNITYEQLLNYQPKQKNTTNMHQFSIFQPPDYFHELNSKVQHQYEILDGILHLCEIYFTKKTMVCN